MQVLINVAHQRDLIDQNQPAIATKSRSLARENHGATGEFNDDQSLYSKLAIAMAVVAPLSVATASETLAAPVPMNAI